MLHPEDRTAPSEETGPWRALLLGGTVAWICLLALERELLAAGTSPWALVRSAYSLVVAPAVAAALLQDARVQGDSTVAVGDAEARADRAVDGSDGGDPEAVDGNGSQSAPERPDGERSGMGRARFGYALVALAFPPVCLVYLLHQRRVAA